MPGNSNEVVGEWLSIFVWHCHHIAYTWRVSFHTWMHLWACFIFLLTSFPAVSNKPSFFCSHCFLLSWILNFQSWTAFSSVFKKILPKTIKQLSLIRYREGGKSPITQKNKELQKVGHWLNSPVPRANALWYLRRPLHSSERNAFGKRWTTFFDLFWRKKMINTIKQVVWIMSDERICSSLLIPWTIFSIPCTISNLHDTDD